MSRRLVAFAALAVTVVGSLWAADTYVPKVEPASDEAAKRIQRFTLPAGMKASLWAAEPLLANPVAFAFDERGRCFVAETYRHSAGVPDIRDHPDWLDDDLAARTVEDRFNLLKKHLGDRFDSYARHHDRVKVVWDGSGKGVADRAEVFADGFNAHAAGIGSGVLARRGAVWYTCIPDLWKLTEKNGSNRADERTVLSTGYGVHIGFIGHDLHGLRMGPDGKLYFTVGDRGLNVAGRVVNADSGAVLRCNPDGSNLEVFATGLRNPQELAFDEYGNLFTCDNNSDSGDKARWVHVVEGGDSGWRFGYQFLEGDYRRGPWNAEKLWQPAPDNTGGYVVPPLANLADGPSGLTYDPGTGLPEAYRGRFFLADFRGANSGMSGVRAIKLKPKGASFEVAENKEFVWGVLATDVDFAPDGAMYVSDWHEGWQKPGKGRLYRIADPKHDGSPLQQEVKRLLAEGMGKRPVEELVKLLGHADQRVRQEAQFSLADKMEASVNALKTCATQGASRLARIHALWAIGQMRRPGVKTHLAETALSELQHLAEDRDPEIRAQFARTCGDARAETGALARLLDDPEPRVRYFAAVRAGKIGDDSAFTRLVAMIRRNDGSDTYLRHAGAFALAEMKRHKTLTELIDAGRDPSAEVRRVVALALRRLQSPEIGRFLSDADPTVVLEAARAIHDVPIPAAEPQLAALIERDKLAEPVARRVLAANFRQGNAAALAAFVVRTDVSETLRGEALRLLGEWPKPSGRDPVTGLWRPVEARPAAAAVDAIRPHLDALFAGPDAVRVRAAGTVAKLGMDDAAPRLVQLFESKGSGKVRAAALEAIEGLHAPDWEALVKKAATDRDGLVRTAAFSLVGKLPADTAIKLLEAAMETGAVRERQAALTTLGTMKDRQADTILGRLLDKLLAGGIPPELKLDLLEAAGKRRGRELRRKLDTYEAARPKADSLAAYREALAGGDPEKGKKLFYEKTAVACLRCHKVGNDGGEVGPNLTQVAKDKTREYLLESLVDPNKQIAKGFETTMILTKAGVSHAGVVKSEDNAALTLMTPEAKTVTIKKADIDTRESGPSSMPADIVKQLTKAELRDVVEYLAGLK